MKINKSFYDWCIENDRQDILDRWDYELNKCSPKDINSNTHKKYYFKCPRKLHESELFAIYSITGTHIYIKCKKCNSFAQWCIDNISSDYINKYWDYDTNKDIDPWNISHANNKLRICLFDDNRNKHFVNTNDFTNKKNYINLKNGIGSAYSSSSYVAKSNMIRLDDKYPDIIKIWSDKNKKSPHDYSYKSHNKVWITDHKGNDYYILCYFIFMKNITIDNIYIKMNKSIENSKYIYHKKSSTSKLENKVIEYLNTNYSYTVNHEKECKIVVINPKTQRRLLYDNEIEELKLVIEVNGKQHYFINSLIRNSAIMHGLTSEQELHKRKLYDRYKKYMAYVNGYEYIAIPWWTEFDDSYKRMIDVKIHKIERLKQNHSVDKQ